MSSTLDVFELRARQHAASGVGLTGDFGLLHAVDDRLAAYGFETNTGVKFVAVVDMRGRRIDAGVAAGLVTGADERRERERRLGARAAAAVGLREGEMKLVSFVFFLFFSYSGLFGPGGAGRGKGRREPSLAG